MMPTHKYHRFAPVALDDRTWPSRSIERAPRWCSVDLRDGNQALVEPMGTTRKSRLWDLLLHMGFKEIEVGYPAASQVDFTFVRDLIVSDRIPNDVTIAVLTAARPELIRRTFDAIRDAKHAVVHLYNSTSTLQRDVVFGLDRQGVIDLASSAVRLIVDLSSTMPETEITLEYSPESFTGTELDFAVEVCDAVTGIWRPSPDRKIILNLPATVEMASPNLYADQIEWFGRHVARRDSVVLSIHPHNDRGTAVAAAELALMAGADRVEGTLFGNGERTGNVDLVTLALNLFTQGVDPQLDLSDIPAIVHTVEFCNRLPVHARHPYGGELVFTSFSGSHQDAIRKGLSALDARTDGRWEVPYLPIDPRDIGRSYEAVIRVNSQSGKAGVTYLLERDNAHALPRALQLELSELVQSIAESDEREVAPEEIEQVFEGEFFSPTAAYRLSDYRLADGIGCIQLHATVGHKGRSQTICGAGAGPIDAFVDGLRTSLGLKVIVLDYSEHTTARGADATAVAYVQVSVGSCIRYGVGRSSNIVTASLAAVLSGLSRISRDQERLNAAVVI